MILLKFRPEATKSKLETEVKTLVSRSSLFCSPSSTVPKVSQAAVHSPEKPASLVLPLAQICGHTAIHLFMQLRLKLGPLYIGNQVKCRAQTEQVYNKC